MKKQIIIALLLCACGVSAAAATRRVEGVDVEGFRIARHGDYMSVDMNLGLAGLEVESTRAVLLTPVVINGADSLELPSVAVYGRRRYYHYRRFEGENMLSGKDETTLRADGRPSSVAYHQMFPFEGWMDGAKVVVRRRDYGCCRTLVNESGRELGGYWEAFFPELVYMKPAAVVEKRRSLEGRSYIDFPVDQTVIYPDYRRNAIELSVIRATIDTVRNDPDATIDTVWLKGYASPESPYSHNRDLAIGRTAALKRYIQQIYNFADAAMITDYEPEDWEGLRAAVVSSDLEHRSEILALIDSDREPDNKEWVIKSTYPEDYKYMLQNFYPALRHTDYRVSYVIRTYSEPHEILSIMHRHPEKLSQTEFYLAASELEPGTDEFTEVFETAVRVFPDDEVANLNAANAAMRRGDLDSAERYLSKAGTGAEAVYARGALAIQRKDYESARRYLAAAKRAGLEQAGTTLEELNKRVK